MMTTPPWHHPNHYVRAVRSWSRRQQGKAWTGESSFVGSQGGSNKEVRKQFLWQTRSNKVPREEEAQPQEEEEEKKQPRIHFPTAVYSRDEEVQPEKKRKLTKEKQEETDKGVANMVVKQLGEESKQIKTWNFERDGPWI